MESLNFDGFLNKLTKAIDLKSYKKRPTIDEKLAFCWQETSELSPTAIDVKAELLKFVQKLLKKSLDSVKSEEKAKLSKENGTKAFCKKNDIEAIKSYTDALRLAPPTSELVPLLYANRSAVLLELHHYWQCLYDVQRALASGYPVNLRYKLYLRQMKCFQAVGMQAQAKNALELVRKFIGHLKPQEQDKIEQTLSVMDEDPQSSTENMDDLFSYEIYKGQSEDMPSMSSVLELRSNKREGRHVITNQRVKKGKTLFIEKPFAMILLPETIYSHCQNCAQETLSPIPCDSCSDVVWCSDDCRADGQRFHVLECGFTAVFSGVGVAHLSLRIVLEAGIHTCLQISGSVKRNDVSKVNAFKQLDHKQAYQSVYSLLSHFDDLLIEDQVSYTLVGLILISLLESKMSAINHPDLHLLQVKANRLQMATVLTHHTSQLTCNAHAIVQLQATDTETHFENISPERIGSAVYSSVSLLNHSCVPSVISIFEGSTIIVRSIENLEKGDQVFNCYGPRATALPREERQEVLRSQYFFTCTCTACVDPARFLMEKYWKAVICPSCRKGAACWTGDILECFSCNRFFRNPPAELVSRCDRIDSLFEKGIQSEDLMESQDCFAQAVSMIEDTYAPDNIFASEICNEYAKTLAKAGRFVMALNEIMKTLGCIERRFGRESIEVGHELLKIKTIEDALARVNHKTNSIENLDERLQKIFTVYYAENWRRFARLCS